VYTAFAGSYSVGFAMLGWFREANFLSDTAEVLAIAVVPDRRRGGVGRLLMEEIERAARSHYARVLLLHTAVDNQPAKELFRKCGFKKGQVKRGFYPAGQDAIAMFKVLKRARFIRPALTEHSSFLLPHSSSLVE
jgi:ribosomal-protein-alanine N-acetyltransferase